MPMMPAYYTTVRNTPRKTKNKRNAKAQTEHDAWLKKIGVDLKPKKRYTKPLKIESKRDTTTSDQIPGNGSKRDSNQYTGNEIAGIALNHKQNYEPVRRDNKQAAIDSAQMRRN
jgi:hypothetical protein